MISRPRAAPVSPGGLRPAARLRPPPTATPVACSAGVAGPSGRLPADLSAARGLRAPQGYEPRATAAAGLWRAAGVWRAAAGYDQSRVTTAAGLPPQQQGYGPPPVRCRAWPQPYGSSRRGQEAVPPGAPGPIPEWWERLLGRFLDNLLFVVVSTVLSSIVGAAFIPSTAEIITNGFQLGYSYYLAMAVVYVITGVLFACYDVAMHSRNGQTLGKMALKTRVVTPSGGARQASLISETSSTRPAVSCGRGFHLIPSLLSRLVDADQRRDSWVCGADPDDARAVAARQWSTHVVKAIISPVCPAAVRELKSLAPFSWAHVPRTLHGGCAKPPVFWDMRVVHSS